MSGKTKAELQDQVKELKARIEELEDINEAVQIVGEFSAEALLIQASEKTENQRVQHLIKRAIAKLGE